MAIQDEAALILQLYDLRREETMRTARNWYSREFNPESMADIESAFFSDHSGHLRMVTSYWDMAAALVNNGAISAQLFNDTNGEHIGVFSKAMHREQGQTAVRRIQGLLSFQKKYGVARVDEACAMALEMEISDFRFVRRYLERQPQLPLSLRRWIR